VELYLHFSICLCRVHMDVFMNAELLVGTWVNDRGLFQGTVYKRLSTGCD
jgi:hypothetical protein